MNRNIYAMDKIAEQAEEDLIENDEFNMELLGDDDVLWDGDEMNIFIKY